MFEMIEGRRKAEKKEERSDLFSSLLDAADEDSEDKITDRELVGELLWDLALCPLIALVYAGNIFIFLLAGHEVRP